MKTIVVGIDASERNRHVIEEAVKLARAFNAKILPVRAVGIPVELPFEAFQLRPDQFETTVIDAAKQSLAIAVKAIPPELSMPAEVHLGAPWQVICEAATKTAAVANRPQPRSWAGLI